MPADKHPTMSSNSASKGPPSGRMSAMEICICLFVVLAVLLALIFVGSPGIVKLRDLMQAKSGAATTDAASDKLMDDEAAQDYGYHAQSDAAADFFSENRWLNLYRGRNINPFTIERTILANLPNAERPAAPPADFQSSFLRELSGDGAASAAGETTSHIPPLFTGGSEISNAPGKAGPEETPPDTDDLVNGDG